MDNNHIFAVITGDIIGSRTLGPSNWMPKLREVLGIFGESPMNWDIYRGDGFQLIVGPAQDALMVAMRIKAGLKSQPGLDTRLAIGIGDISFESERVGECSGTAFIHSGALVEKLDGMHTTLALLSPWKELDSELNASLALAASIMDRWLPNYAQSMAASLDYPELTQKDLGAKLGMAQNTLSERLSRAYKRELLQFESVFRRKLISRMTGTIS